MPIKDEEIKQLLEKANTLPMRPGVYIMKGANDNVIYVGKSRKLKNRKKINKKSQKILKIKFYA